MMVAAGGDEGRVPPVTLRFLEAEQIAIETKGTVEVGDLEVDMADPRPPIDRRKGSIGAFGVGGRFGQGVNL